MRRRFDHLHVELSVAVGVALPRYPLWLHLAERGWNPEFLTREEVLTFWDQDLDAFLLARGAVLPKRCRPALRRRLVAFHEKTPSPEEAFLALTD